MVGAPGDPSAELPRQVLWRAPSRGEDPDADMGGVSPGQIVAHECDVFVVWRPAEGHHHEAVCHRRGLSRDQIQCADLHLSGCEVVSGGGVGDPLSVV